MRQPGTPESGPILGCEVYVAKRTRHDREHLLDRKSYHLILLCENQKGYQNLVKLVSLASLDGFYQKPRVDWELLSQYHEGLICLDRLSRRRGGAETDRG